MIPGRDQARSGFGGEPRRFTRMLDFAREQIGNQRLRVPIGRVVHDEAVRAEDRLEPPPEGVRHALARRVRPAQLIQQIGCEFGGRQHRGKFADGRFDRVVEPDVCHRTVVSAGHVRQ